MEETEEVLLLSCTLSCVELWSTSVSLNANSAGSLMADLVRLDAISNLIVKHKRADFSLHVLKGKITYQ